MRESFDEIFEDCTKLGTKIKADEYHSSGKYPIVDQGQDQIAGFTNLENGLFTAVPAIIFGDHTRIIKYVDSPFFLGADGVKVLRCREPNANYRYLYYALRSAKIPNTGYNRHYKWLKELEIEYPSISQQIKTVKVLDEVASIIRNRQQQLQKLDELIKARFVELFGDDKYSKTPLINLITEGAGLSYGIVQPGDSGTGDMGVLRPVDMVNGKISTHSIKYIDRSIGASFKKTELVGDELLITVRGTTGVTALTDSRFKNMNVTRGIAVIRYDRRKINPIYLNAFLNTDESQQYIQEHTRGATLQQINLSDLRVHMIPVPPIELQEKLADFIQQVDKSKLSPYRDCWTRCNFCLAVWCDNTSNKEDIMEWLMNLDPSIWAALIGAVGAIIVALIKVIIPLFKKKEKGSDKVAPSINQTVTGNGNTVIGIQNNMKGEKDGQ